MGVYRNSSSIKNMSGEAPKLEPRQLFETRVRRDAAKLRAYNQILTQIQSRIKTTAALPGNPNYLLYTVPPFILGLPAIDLQDCIVYVVHQLRTGGYEVRFTYPNLLFISWKHYEQEYMREQNPITQAMKPPAPSNTSKKGAGGKRGMNGGMNNGMNNGMNGMGPKVSFSQDLSRIGGAPAAPRSAAEYQPPDSFLEGIQRPVKTPGNATESVLAQLWKF